MTTEFAQLYVALHGSDAPRVAREKAAECEAAGDTTGSDAWTLRAQACEAHIRIQAEERTRIANMNIEECPLFGGISGIALDVPSIEILPGAVLTSTYAHVMAPYLIAFARAAPGRPHPAPWKAASGGIGFDVEIQFELATACKPTGFSRLNTVWWLLALLRLHHAIGIRIPIVSDTPFSEIANASLEPRFGPSRWLRCRDGSKIIFMIASFRKRQSHGSNITS